jgi:UDP-N-acetylglucosamine 4,6-dehydratase/5-epimerase
MSLDGKVVLVTGGTGSFGRRFAQLVLERYDVRKLIVFSRDELKQSEMAHDFAGGALAAKADRNVRYFIGDVRDLERLRRAMRDVDVVVHAAAMKQVPACEYNPFEAVKTNVLGGANIIEAAIDCGVRKVLAISTDKAVNPINLYGATKLCAEKLFVQGNSYSTPDGARFSCARYGNVVGSRGSVVPLFRQQRENGVVTVTDERMTRFWITLEQGVEFVLRCIDIMEGGEIFVPKLPSMRILDLAAAIAPGAEIKVTGIRPGEKVHEVLVSEDEAHHTIEYDDLYVVKPTHPWWRKDGWGDGRPLPAGFRFASDSNDRWLSIEDLRGLTPE